MRSPFHQSLSSIRPIRFIAAIWGLTTALTLSLGSEAEAAPFEFQPGDVVAIFGDKSEHKSILHKGCVPIDAEQPKLFQHALKL